MNLFLYLLLGQGFLHEKHCPLGHGATLLLIVTLVPSAFGLGFMTLSNFLTQSWEKGKQSATHIGQNHVSIVFSIFVISSDLFHFIGHSVTLELWIASTNFYISKSETQNHLFRNLRSIDTRAKIYIDYCIQ